MMAAIADMNEPVHALERTSPKGGPFVGRCRLCGQDGFPPAAAAWTCPSAVFADVDTPDEDIELQITRRELCELGFHDVYLTRCILGYDYQCRVCGLCRYYDVDPPQWSRYDSGRNPENLGYPLNECMEYAGAYPLTEDRS